MDIRALAGSVSVVIPTFNCQRTIGYTLRSIAQQTYRATEVLIIDKLSRDETVPIALAHGARVSSCLTGVSSARNLGLSLSAGEYVLFLDGDQMLESTCLEECVALCENMKADAVKIPELFLGMDYWGKCFALLKNVNFDLGVKRDGDESLYPRFWRKQELLEIGGFDERLLWGEDAECFLRAKRSGLISSWSRSRIVHLDMQSLSAVIRKRMKYASGIRTYKRNVGQYSVDPYVGYASRGVRSLPDIVARSRDPKLLWGAFLLIILIAGSAVLQR